MYLIEWIVKKLIQKKENIDFNPVSDEEIKDYEECEHIFMPLDSSNETLSCTKCGTVVKKEELKNKFSGKNFFIQNQ